MTSDAPVRIAVVCPQCAGSGVIHAQVAEREPLSFAGLLELDTPDTDPAPAPDDEEE